MKLEQLKALAAEGKLEGLFPNVENGVYHHPEGPGVSSTFLKKIISETPAHALASLSEEKEESPALRVGSAFHDSVLLPELFSARYVALPEGMKRDARMKVYQEFVTANKGKTILSSDEWTQIISMRDAVLNHPRASQLLIDAKPEHSAWWTDPATGVLCKVRPDIITPQGYIVDLKSTVSANAWDFSKSIHSYGYHISAAMYLNGMSHVLGLDLKTFVLLAVEKKAPFGVALYVIDQGTLEKGMEEFRRALQIYAHCKETGDFYGYPIDFQDIAIPAYAF